MKLHPQLRINITFKELLSIPILLTGMISFTYTLSLFFLGEDFFELIPKNHIVIAGITGIIIFILSLFLYSYLNGFIVWLKKQEISGKFSISYRIGLVITYLYFIYLFISRLSSKKGYNCFSCIFEDETKRRLFFTLVFVLTIIFVIINLSVYVFLYIRKKNKK